MRAVIYGAGAIGGVIGARLFQSDHDVVFIARGDNYDALFQNGIRLETPDETATLHVPVVEDPAALSYSSSDVVLLAMKGQDTLDALRRLVTVVPASTAIVCAQNGVENERVALRMFENVYGMCVMCPATHLVPGVVRPVRRPLLVSWTWVVGHPVWTSERRNLRLNYATQPLTPSLAVTSHGGSGASS
ncbi:MAG: ketopantoate reductase family protein [Acidimicrobiales bacterium]